MPIIAESSFLAAEDGRLYTTQNFGQPPNDAELSGSAPEATDETGKDSDQTRNQPHKGSR
jgi:hypothetical protein